MFGSNPSISDFLYLLNAAGVAAVAVGEEEEMLEWQQILPHYGRSGAAACSSVGPGEGWRQQACEGLHPGSGGCSPAQMAHLKRNDICYISLITYLRSPLGMIQELYLQSNTTKRQVYRLFFLSEKKKKEKRNMLT